jgi:hypothetical protein
MFAIFNQSAKRDWRRWAALCALVFCLCGAAHTAHAQGNFNSGSTGADGAFNPTSSQAVQLPESSVFNFTTVNIPAGVTITFKRNSRNTPVTILASGDVTILGTIDVSGGNGSSNNIDVGIGGPGGFNGGKGGSRFLTQNGASGDGPGGGGGALGNDNSGGIGGGGGFATFGLGFLGNLHGTGGSPYGTKTLLPLVGGSGGGGGGANVNFPSGSGGGGGGAILIASSGTITFSNNSNAHGVISANGGTGGCNNNAGGGSGGAIRLIANAITGSANLQTTGGRPGCDFTSSTTSSGYIRVESFNFNGFDLVNVGTVSSGLPGLITLTNAPTLAIASVGGVAAPASPAGSLSAPPDITLPSTQTNPVTVALQASNIPLNTTVRVRLIPPTGAPTSVQSTPLTGTVASSTATASLTLPAGQSLIYATASIDLTTSTASAQPLFIDGERVRRIEVGAAYGGASEAVYVTESGKRVKLE